MITGHLYHDDIQGILGTALTGGSQWTPAQLRSTGIVLNRVDQSDYFTMIFQLPHRKQLEANLDDIHLHFVPLSASAGDLVFDVKWEWIPVGGIIPSTLTQTAGSYAVTIPLVAGDQYVHKIHSLASDITFPTGENYSSILLVRVARGAGANGDTYTTGSNAGIQILYMDAHYPCNRYGSYLVTSDT